MTLTAKQEAFCQAMLSPKADQSEAYRQAFNAENMKHTTIASKASLLMTRDDIRARIEELRKPVVEAVGMTLQGHLNDLKDIRDQAIADGKWGPAVMAEMGRAKAAGYHITKVEDVTDPLRKAMGNMSPERAEQLMNALDQVEAARNKGKAKA